MPGMGNSYAYGFFLDSLAFLGYAIYIDAKTCMCGIIMSKWFIHIRGGLCGRPIFLLRVKFVKNANIPQNFIIAFLPQQP